MCHRSFHGFLFNKKVRCWIIILYAIETDQKINGSSRSIYGQVIQFYRPDLGHDLFNHSPPLAVSRYRWRRLCGFSGIVYSTSLRVIRSFRTTLSCPDTLFWPRYADISEIEASVICERYALTLMFKGRCLFDWYCDWYCSSVPVFSDSARPSFVIRCKDLRCIGNLVTK